MTGNSWAADLPYLLEVKKNTPLFTRPSLNSEKVADAEEGTLLLFIGRSKKGIWVKLQDADGTQGWMPAERTDFKQVDAARVASERIGEISQAQPGREGVEEAAPKKLSKEEMMQQILEESKPPFRATLRVAPFVRWLSDDPPAPTRLGMRAEYNLGGVSSKSTGRTSDAWAVGEVTVPAPQINHNHDFTAALRYAGRTPIFGPLVYGPDFGYSVDKVSHDYRHHFSIGLSAGANFGPVDLAIRGGYDFFARSRAMIDAQLGISF